MPFGMRFPVCAMPRLGKGCFGLRNSPSWKPKRPVQDAQMARLATRWEPGGWQKLGPPPRLAWKCRQLQASDRLHWACGAFADIHKFSIQKTKRLRTANNCAQPVYAPLLLLNIRKAHIQRSYNKKLPLHCVPLRSQRTYASSLPCFIHLCKMRTFTLPFYFFTF